jgi:hypothetical protein
MVVTIGGTRYNFYFHYNHDSNGQPIQSSCHIEQTTLEDGEYKNVEVAAGYAYCHPEDKFDKEKARKITLTRALEDFFPYTEDTTRNWNNILSRRLFWNVYLNRREYAVSMNGNR